MTSTNRMTRALSVCVVLVMTACASVPKEAVTLSDAVGQDIEQLQTGYRQTVRFSFNQMRKAGLSVIDNVWTPAFLKHFIEEGTLVEFAKEADENDRAELVEFWAREAIEEIDIKRKEFTVPLQEKEDALLANIDAAFDRLIRANAAVTAHLNSVVKVQELQDKALDMAGLRDVRDKVNAAIVDASQFSADAIKDVEAAAEIFDPPSSKVEAAAKKFDALSSD